MNMESSSGSFSNNQRSLFQTMPLPSRNQPAPSGPQSNNNAIRLPPTTSLNRVPTQKAAGAASNYAQLAKKAQTSPVAQPAGTLIVDEEEGVPKGPGRPAGPGHGQPGATMIVDDSDETKAVGVGFQFQI
jgi:hypothetical protein